MAKKTPAVQSDVAVSATPAPVVEAAIAAVATPESVLPAISVDALITALTNPESRASTTKQLDDRIAVRRAELEQLEMARRALDLQPGDAPKPVAKNLSPKKKAAPRATNTQNGDHATAILSTLKGEKNGLMIGDISKKLTAMNHPMDQKSLASYLWSMTKGGKLVKEGERGQYRYKPAPVSA